MAASLGSASVSFGTTDVHDTVAGSVMLNADSLTGSTWTVASSDAQFVADVSSVVLSAGGQQQVALAFTPTTTGAKSATLTFTNDDDATTLTCALDGTAADDPWVDNEITELDFGVTAQGSSEIGVISICVPAGSSDVTFTIEITGSCFTASTASATVSGGASASVIVTYTPDGVGEDLGTLTLKYTDSNGVDQELSVSLEGEGVADDEAEDTADAAAGESATATAESTTYQRATLYVPTEICMISLGAAYELDGSTVSQAGFQASSTAHVFFRAAGAATLQANGNVWFQSSSSSTYALAGENVYFVAGTQVIVGSKSLTGLCAGFFGSPVDATQGSCEPGDPTGISEIGTGFLLADISFATIDVLITFGNRWKDYHEFVALKKWKERGWAGLKKVWNVLKFIGYALWTCYQAVSFVIDRAMGMPAYAVSLTGSAGVLSGTPSIQVFTGSASTVLSSLNTTVLGIVGYSMESGYSSTVDSVFGETLVNAGTSMSLIGGGVTKTVSRFNTASYYGTTVTIGDLVPDLRQKPTVYVLLDALKSITLESALNVTVEGQMGLGSSLELSAFSGEVTSSVNTTIACVAGYKVEMTPAGISITGSTGELVKLTAASITLGPAAAPILVSAAAVDLANSTLTIAPSGLTSMGMTVDLL